MPVRKSYSGSVMGVQTTSVEDMTIVFFSPTATKTPVPSREIELATPYRLLVVFEVRDAQLLTLPATKILPLAPTATYRPKSGRYVMAYNVFVTPELPDAQFM